MFAERLMNYGERVRDETTLVPSWGFAQTNWSLRIESMALRLSGFFTDFNGCFQHGLSFSFPQKNRMRVR
jgi:hypothetical protein